MTNNKKKLNVNGISLIVLVITIIVIIIIAGAIILSLNNSGIIGKSTLARESNDFANIRQMVEIEKTNKLLTDKFDKEKIQIPNIYIDDIEITDTGKIILKHNDDTKITDIQNAIEKLGASYLLDGFDYVETISSREFDSEKLAEYDYRNVAKIIIEGKSEQVQTVQGKNLFDMSLFQNQNKNLYSIDVSENLSVILGDNRAWSTVPVFLTLNPNTVYTLSVTNACYLEVGNGLSKIGGITNNKYTFTSSNDGKTSFKFAANQTSGFVIGKIQLEMGSTATSYEPFIPNSPSPDYPSSINSVENFDLITKNVVEQIQTINFPYTLRSLPDGTKDYIEIDNVNKTSKLVRNIGEKVFIGNETFTIREDLSGNEYTTFQNNINISIHESRIALCNYFKLNNTPIPVLFERLRVAGTSFVQFSIFGISDINVFKSLITSRNTLGNPVKVQYKLANPSIINLNYEEIKTYYPYNNIYTNATVRPTIGVKIIID